MNERNLPNSQPVQLVGFASKLSCSISVIFFKCLISFTALSEGPLSEETNPFRAFQNVTHKFKKSREILKLAVTTERHEGFFFYSLSERNICFWKQKVIRDFPVQGMLFFPYFYKDKAKKKKEVGLGWVKATILFSLLLPNGPCELKSEELHFNGLHKA